MKAKQNYMKAKTELYKGQTAYDSKPRIISIHEVYEMIKNMFSKIFGNKKNIKGEYLIVQLNDKIMPIDRGHIYEEPLEKFLHKNKYGEVTGGGTMQLKTGEIEFCDLEILIYHDQNIERIGNEIIQFLEVQGAPKGSLLTIDNSSKKYHLESKKDLLSISTGLIFLRMFTKNVIPTMYYTN